MFSILQCLILYIVVCGLLTLVCWLLFKVIPWPWYLMTAVLMAAVICYNQGYMTVFLVLSIINFITILPYVFATLVNIGKLIIPAAIEIIFTIIQVSHVPAVPSWQKKCLGLTYAAFSLQQMLILHIVMLDTVWIICIDSQWDIVSFKINQGIIVR